MEKGDKPKKRIPKKKEDKQEKKKPHKKKESRNKSKLIKTHQEQHVKQHVHVHVGDEKNEKREKSKKDILSNDEKKEKITPKAKALPQGRTLIRNDSTPIHPPTQQLIANHQPYHRDLTAMVHENHPPPPPSTGRIAVIKKEEIKKEEQKEIKREEAARAVRRPPQPLDEPPIRNVNFKTPTPKSKTSASISATGGGRQSSRRKDNNDSDYEYEDNNAQIRSVGTSSLTHRAYVSSSGLVPSFNLPSLNMTLHRAGSQDGGYDALRIENQEIAPALLAQSAEAGFDEDIAAEMAEHQGVSTKGARRGRDRDHNFLIKYPHLEQLPNDEYQRQSKLIKQRERRERERQEREREQNRTNLPEASLHLGFNNRVRPETNPSDFIHQATGIFNPNTEVNDVRPSSVAESLNRHMEGNDDDDIFDGTAQGNNQINFRK